MHISTWKPDINIPDITTILVLTKSTKNLVSLPHTHKPDMTAVSGVIIHCGTML